MKILLSFICLSLSLGILVGCGDKNVTEENKEVEQPVVNDVVEPESATDENVFDKLLEGQEDVTDKPAAPAADTENVFDQLFEETQDGGQAEPSKKPSIPALPPVDEPTAQIPEKAAEPANVFGTMPAADSGSVEPVADAPSVFDQLLNNE